ncbi:MAG: type II toxin-antitoxin system VapC family toxin [Burkholderiaceae bacterium]
MSSADETQAQSLSTEPLGEDWSRFVLDASIALRWCFGDGSAIDKANAESVLLAISQGSQVVVPPIWPLEIGNVLLRAERAGHVDRSRIDEFLRLLTEMPISIDERASRRALTDTLGIADMRNLSTYDASYLELATEEGLPLATLDAKLSKAARDGGVTTL